MKTFNIGDKVSWRFNKDGFFQRKLGNGPFVIRDVRPAKYAGTAGNRHQEVLLINCDTWFNTAWFKKVK